MIRVLLDVSLKRLRRLRSRRSPLKQPPEPGAHRFVFLGGLHRSGTSILHRLLREHPDISGFENTGVPEDEGQHLQSVFPAAYAYGGPGRFAFDPHARLTETSELVSPVSRDQLLREWGAYYDLTKPVLLEKSPPNLIRARFFQALLPGSCFIFIVRHPVAVACATQKWQQTTPLELFWHWCVAHRLMLADLPHLQSAMLLRYEDLVARPTEWLAEICRMAGLEPFDPKEAVADHNRRYFAAWQPERALWDSSIGAIQDLLGGALSSFGYSLDEPYVEPWSGSGHQRPTPRP